MGWGRGGYFSSMCEEVRQGRVEEGVGWGWGGGVDMIVVGVQG